MYVVGSSESHKASAEQLLRPLVIAKQTLVTDCEVLQEILHRYASTNRRHAIQPAFDFLLSVVDQVFPVDRFVIERAKQIVLGYTLFSARDAVHLAVMEHQGITQILSFDTDYDQFPGIKRIS